MRMVGGFHNAK